jgi:hypothetical protein
MRRFSLFALSALAIGLMGCSKVQSTTILAEKWETGQHLACVFAHQNLYCFQVGAFSAPMPKGVSVLAAMAGKTTPYFLESERAEVLASPGADGGVYDAKFISHTPMDFSLWNCYKTGVGSPAISCDLTAKPTNKETELFVQTEAKQAELHRLAPAIVAHLRGLTPEGVIAACGPVKEVKDIDGLISVGRTEGAEYVASYGKVYMRYPFADMEWFQGRIDKVGGWYSRLDSSSPDDAAAAVQDAPCLRTGL